MIKRDFVDRHVYLERIAVEWLIYAISMEKKLSIGEGY